MTDPRTAPDVEPGTRRRRWHLVGAVALVIVGVMLGSATTSVVWASHQFPDVPNSHPFHDDIEWLVDAGITEGYDDGTFRPSNSVSRAAMAAFLHRLTDSIELEVEEIDFTNQTSVEGSVACPSDKRLISGGSTVVANGLMDMQSSGPFFGSWTARHTSGVARTGTLVVMVTCIPA